MSNNKTNEQLHEWVELYNLDLLEADDKAAFEKELEVNIVLRNMLTQHQAFMRLISHKGAKDTIRTQMDIIRKEQKSVIHKVNDGLKLHVNKYWKTASIAASVAFMASFLTFSVTKRNFDKDLHQQNILLSKIGNAVVKTADGVNSLGNAMMQDMPKGNAKKSGTAFLLNNKGYILTNAHVIDASTDLYVNKQNGAIAKVTVVKKDITLDLAILKLEDAPKGFMPNTTILGFANKDANTLADNIYSLGYPNNTITYNEGYISNLFGANDDGKYYQLELPSNHGSSGSPIFNTSGTIVGVVNSKESLGVNTTYALLAIEIKKFIATVPEVTISNAKTNNKQQLIKAANDAILIVRAY